MRLPVQLLDQGCWTRVIPLINLRLSRNCSVQAASDLKNVGKSNVNSSSDTSCVSKTIAFQNDENVMVLGNSYSKDSCTNVTNKILSQVGRNLHNQPYHPLCLIKRRILDFFNKNFHGKSMRTPLFTVLDNLNPSVTIEQNFDSLLVPEDHPSRKKTDCYYINQNNLLRAHTTAHQSELIKQGLNNFLVVGDVYRRDEIDRTHYPIFHQVDAVRLCGLHEVFPDEQMAQELGIFDNTSQRTPEKQESHSIDAVMVMQKDLQTTLLKLAQHLFGSEVETRWVDAYFPFTHPSWELEVKFGGEWLETLGCGIMEQSILKRAGAGEKIGWAFGLGLERLAMKLYEIPDIRLFWSTDPGFLHQFKVEDPYTPIKYKPVSIYPPCANDISFWLPNDSSFCSNDFYDLVRTIGGDVIEQVSLVDEFFHKKKDRWSHCYRIVYRHMTRSLTQKEVNKIHANIEVETTRRLRVEIR